MKNILLSSTLFVLLILLMSPDALPQSAAFNTGELGVIVNTYGRVRVYTPDTSGTRQLQRLSILVGVGPNAVFDYQKDADVEDPTMNIMNPLLSDYEIYGAYNNFYSSAPPNVLERLNVYGWNGGEYLLLKFTVINQETSTLEAIIGMDIIPELEQQYGFDTVTYDATNEFIRTHRGGTEMGVKLLSHPLTSLYSFEWFTDYYNEDSSYWNWLNYGAIQPEYISNTLDGPVTITAQDIQIIAPGDSVCVWYALAFASNEADLIANVQAAEQQYFNITFVDYDLNTIPSDYTLEQNYPNPFNPSTKITFGLPESSEVSLKIFNALGEEVAELVNESLEAGKYTYNFNATELTSGIYIYTLQSEKQTLSRKMILIK
jgi:hypothetical protein